MFKKHKLSEETARLVPGKISLPSSRSSHIDSSIHQTDPQRSRTLDTILPQLPSDGTSNSFLKSPSSEEITKTSATAPETILPNTQSEPENSVSKQQLLSKSSDTTESPTSAATPLVSPSSALADNESGTQSNFSYSNLPQKSSKSKLASYLTGMLRFASMRDSNKAKPAKKSLFQKISRQNSAP